MHDEWQSGERRYLSEGSIAQLKLSVEYAFANADGPTAFAPTGEAALSIQAGASVLALSRRLGHAKPSITLDVYSHLYEGVDSEIAEGLDRFWTAAV